ncbi:esterase-like activity of phytase family protein [Algicella marina]|uniref:Esterase-like activity of phytase family protein n=1 Tax=Algicella marina TaxID=2683284 RepID=A0A6P1SZ90_9RHOB|nr:esterase-like activity of phytase family protein [Algicella marina]QHQ36004.1 esterase-like activity of phytase family protein [Algicella marina]
MLRCLALIALLVAPATGWSDMVASTSRLKWVEPYDGFGSFSGIVVSPDGKDYTTVSDKGFYATGSLTRRNGKLTEVLLEENGPLLGVNGEALGGQDIDAEGLTRLPDGRLVVSFEANHRIRIYRNIGGPAETFPSHPAFAKLQNNSGMEALFSDGSGRIYAIPERSGALDRPFPVFRFAKGWTTPFTLRRDPPHLVAGADIGPDGRLYVLERDVGALGFYTRIRRFDITARGLANEQLVISSRMGEFDNLEGLSIWRDARGAIRILCISDDNQKFFQRTEFVEFTLKAAFSDAS